MTSRELALLSQFVENLPRPIEQDHVDFMRVHKGESIFNKIGCADCHVADVRPVSNLFSDLLLHDMGERLQAASPATASFAKSRSHSKTGRRVGRYPVQGPFSGENVSSGSYSGSSSGSMPFAEAIKRPDQPQFPRGKRLEKSNDNITWDDLQREWRTPPLWGVADSAPYLHDGRAENLTEAILWHGGEAQASRDQFNSLPMQKRVLLLEFLGTLRAPDPVAKPKSDTVATSQ